MPGAPAPMPGAPEPVPPAPAPAPAGPAPMPLPGAPMPMPGAPPGPGLPVPSGTPEDLPPIDFIPAARPEPVAPTARYSLSYQGEWWWVPTGPVTGAMSDVALLPGSEVYAAATRTGEVWISPDAGLSWRRVLVGVFAGGGDATSPVQRPTSEDVLSDIDVEVVGDFEAVDDGSALQDADAQLQQAVDDYESSGAEWAQIQLAAESGGRDAPRPRVWFDQNVLYVGRADGLYISDDLGGSWSHPLSETVTAFVPTARGLIAGTLDGMRYSGDGRVWFDRDDGSEGVEVLDLTHIGGGAAYAGTRQGLWFTADGSFWGQRFAFEEPVMHVAVDPDVPNRLWVSLPRTILSSDNQGLNFQEPLTAPMPAVTELIHLGPLHWVCASGDGPWETMNGGLSWVPIARGLLEPDTFGIEAVDGKLVLASTEGVLRIEKAPDLVFDPDAQAALLKDELAAWIPRESLIDSVLGRRELRPGGGGSAMLQYMIPQVTVIGEYRVQDGVDFASGLGQDTIEDGTEEFDITRNGETLREYDRYWRFSLSLRWAAPGKKAGLFGENAVLDAGEAEAGISIDAADLDDGTTGGRAGREAAVYSGQLARRVNELYNARADALQRRVEVSRAPLLQQVHLELYIAEIEGELDALTNGAVSEFALSGLRPAGSRADPANPPEDLEGVP
ncbi:MAG: hypothetical protein R3F61_26680 [Myxococcota bacterium]